MSVSSKNSKITPENESLFTRWSRLKQEKDSEAKAAQNPVSESVLESPENLDDVIETRITETKSHDIHILHDDDMPELESLHDDSDYTGFLSKNVSEGLRKLALQKLFHSETFNLRDGLDDYDGDYTTFTKLDPSIITADMKHRFEVEAEKKLKELASNDIEKDTDADSDASGNQAKNLVNENSFDEPTEQDLLASNVDAEISENSYTEAEHVDIERPTDEKNV